jgi:3-isopropylmalate/(R)-2-methylmalate dehydratase small subunit
MEPFNQLASNAVWLDMANVDTDQIIPSRFMRTPRSQGYGGFVFHDLRFDAQGAPKEAFPLNAPAASEVRIMVAGANFGCGSSREAAVYALADFGIRCIVAPSFGDIFRNNAFRNGLLTIVLDKSGIEALRVQWREANTSVHVDLAKQSISCGGFSARFEIEPFWKECLLAGADDIDFTMRDRVEIEAFFEQRIKTCPWLMPGR